MEEVKISQLVKDVEELKRKVNDPIQSNNLNRYLDNSSKDIIENIISDRILDVVWNDYFYISYLFGDILRLSTAGTGTSAITSDGLLVTLSTTATDTASATLTFDTTRILSLAKESRFRVITKVSDVSDVTVTFYGTYGTTDGVAILIDAGTIKGQTTGSGTTTLNISTVADNTYVTLEYRYYPGNRVDFYVNDKLEGTITTNLPRITNTAFDLFQVAADKTGITGASVLITTPFFEYLQRK